MNQTRKITKNNLFKFSITIRPRLASRLPESRVDDGFTLMETLVAMMLLAIALVVIIQLFSEGLKSSKLADDYTRAIFYARGKMEEFLLKGNLEEGVYEGRFDDEFGWQVEVALVEEQMDEENKPPPVDVYNISVSVNWTSGDREKRFQLETLQIAEKRDEIS